VIAAQPDPFTEVLQSVLAAGGAVRFRAEGDSMRPTICGGEVVTAAPIADGRIVAGDVLLVRSGARLLAHRVVAIERADRERLVYLRGDAKSGCDAPVRPSEILARVVGVERDGRTIGLAGAAARLRYRVRRAASRVWSCRPSALRSARRSLC